MVEVTYPAESATDNCVIEAFLVAREAGVWRDIFRLPAGTVTTVGRDPTNRIILRDEKCSRRHCDVFQESGQWHIRDLNSRNGTRVNDERIRDVVPIGEGDAVRIGGVELLFTSDISRPLDQAGEQMPSDTDDFEIEDDATGPQILERKSRTSYQTESSLVDSSGEGELRGAFAKLYRLVVQMVSAESVRELSETVLAALLESVNADIGAVLLFPHDAEDRTNPGDLRIISYRAPEHLSYQKVSTRLSRIALSESEAILGLDIGKPTGDSEFQTLNDMQAQSVICAPVRHADVILGLLHLYSLDPSKTLDAESLEYTLAVADQFAITVDAGD
jgi:Nif-specific regulatory protein